MVGKETVKGKTNVLRGIGGDEGFLSGVGVVVRGAICAMASHCEGKLVSCVYFHDVDTC